VCIKKAPLAAGLKSSSAARGTRQQGENVTLSASVRRQHFPTPPLRQQPARVPRVGILSDENSLLPVKSFEAFAQGLQALGYVDGQNVAFERRYAEGKNEILPSPRRRVGPPSAGRHPRRRHPSGTGGHDRNPDDPDRLARFPLLTGMTARGEPWMRRSTRTRWTSAAAVGGAC